MLLPKYPVFLDFERSGGASSFFYIIRIYIMIQYDNMVIFLDNYFGCYDFLTPVHQCACTNYNVQSIHFKVL